MSKKNYDSDFCGSLPLHHINLIQSYGCLVVLNLADLQIIQASENVQEIFGLSVNEIVGTFFSEYVPAQEVTSFSEKFKGGITEKVPVSFTLKTPAVEARFIAIVHAKSDYLILEIEKTEGDSSFLEIFQELKYVMAEVNHADSVERASNVIVRQLKKLSGFDRILMYQFDADWNGSVIAEALEEGMDSYLGLHFPASDIPKQARALYLKNPYRLIPAREYNPVRLYPVINPASNTFIDLSDCNLRAVPAVHLEYMKNMKIDASMSIRVLRNDQLWGLISCHHRKPKYLNYEICSVFELLSSVISNKISSLTNNEEFSFFNSLQDKKARVVANIYFSKDLLSGFFGEELNVSDLFNAGGAVMTYGGQVRSAGNVPAEQDLINLIYWLQGKSDDRIYSTSNLAGEYENANLYSDIASGLISIPINAEQGDFLLVFRPEVLTVVNWGGNPGEAINFEAGGQKYHPRNSFGVWQETVKQTSLAWKPEEVQIAESLRSFIFEFNTKNL